MKFKKLTVFAMTCLFCISPAINCMSTNKKNMAICGVAGALLITTISLSKSLKNICNFSNHAQSIARGRIESRAQVHSSAYLTYAVQNYHPQIIASIFTSSRNHITLEEIDYLLGLSYDYFYVMRQEKKAVYEQHYTESTRQLLKTEFIHKLNATPAHDKTQEEWQLLAMRAQERLNISNQKRDVEIFDIIQQKINHMLIIETIKPEQSPIDSSFEPHSDHQNADDTLPQYPTARLVHTHQLNNTYAWYHVWAQLEYLKKTVTTWLYTYL